MRTTTVLGAVLARTQETQKKLYNITTKPHKLISREQSQLSLAPSLLLMLQVNQGIHKWIPNQDVTKGLQ